MIKRTDKRLDSRIRGNDCQNSGGDPIVRVLPKAFLTVLFSLLAVLAFAQGNYYDAVIDLSGQQLYTALHSLIATNTYSSYDGAKVELYQNLDNVNGNVTCIYTGQVYYVGYSYTGSTDPNTEHTYAQSWFSSPESSIKKADLHHLFPTNSVVNSSRGNYPLFTVANHASANVYYTYTPWQSYRGQCSTGYTVFEPADESKGDIARALLYFNTRYYDTLTQQNVNMTPVLAQWSYFDPPDQVEIARNQGIYEFQGNRNPYVDHPEFVGRIWGGVESDDPVTPSVAGITLSGVYPNPFSDKATISLNSKGAKPAVVEVFNLRGQRIRRLDQELKDGANAIAWDGRNDSGNRVATGVYLVRVVAGTDLVSAKVMLD
jgi:hypothetical protein